MSYAPAPSRPLRAVTLLSTALLLVGCADLPPAKSPSPSKAQGILITHEEIEASGARDAWEAIRKHVNHLRFAEDSDGDPIWIGAHRGSTSFVRRDAILLVVDGTLMANSAYLRYIPARAVAWIQILSAHEGTARYGIAAGNGAVVVQTFSPDRGVVAEG